MPLSDSAPRYRWPILVGLLAIAIVAVYFLQADDARHAGLLESWALIPRDLHESWARLVAQPGLIFNEPRWFLDSIVRPLCGSSFLSSGPVHVGVAVAFLWVFGDNVEGRLGRVRFVALWMVGACVAGAVHTWLRPRGEMPVVGATGAIAALLGSYTLLFRRARVHVVRYLEVPCWVFLASFFVLQIGPVQQAFGWVEVLDGLDVRAHVASYATGLALTPLLLIANRCPEQLGRVGKRKNKKPRARKARA